ncbi:Lsr2 dimerization domain-containing protein [Nocardia carnea]|uniref:Lsr2 dimerization domain-containing protein n=1 Tax=Nocardia carnea TaxID=37328 RepID=UPI003D7B953D
MAFAAVVRGGSTILPAVLRQRADREAVEQGVSLTGSAGLLRWYRPRCPSADPNTSRRRFLSDPSLNGPGGGRVAGLSSQRRSGGCYHAARASGRPAGSVSGGVERTVVVAVIDDLDGESATAETVLSGIVGATDEMDLPETNARELRASLDNWVRSRAESEGNVVPWLQRPDLFCCAGGVSACVTGPRQHQLAAWPQGPS